MKVLHLVGSPSSEFYYHCSLMYARSLFETDYPAVVKNRNVIAVVHPDGTWSLPTNLDEDLQHTKRYSMAEAMEIIEVLAPNVLVQHMQCEQKFAYNAMFELLNIPYIGSDSKVSSMIVDKAVTRAVLSQAGVPVPSGVVITRNDDNLDYKDSFPAVVKPTMMENSVGVCLVRDRVEMEAALADCWQFGDTAIIDTFIPGREVRCGAVEMVEGEIQALGCIEYKVARDNIRTFGDKLEGEDDGLRQAASTTSWMIDESQEPDLVNKLQKIAVRIHRVMGCRDFSQFDCRVTTSGEVFVLEVNNFCSFGPLSLVPKIAERAGIANESLYSCLLDKAARRAKLESGTSDIKSEY